MSEYQYYEFRTVDRSLTPEEIAELRKLSGRAEITSTSFTNTYSYGSFRGDPDRMMERYFDAFVYVTNWGTRHFMVRLPMRGVDLPAIEAYAGGGLSFWIKGEFVILSFVYAGEGDGEWVDGGEWMPGLISLRDELLNGDFRSLYLGWLSGIYGDGDVDDDETEPLVPAGLRTLTAAQDDLVSFLRIDVDLLEAAAERSADRGATGASQAELAEWLRSRRTEEKEAWLLELLGPSAPACRSEVLLQFRESLQVACDQPEAESLPPRTCQLLREAAEAREQEAERRRAAEAAVTREKEAKQAAKLRNLELNRLAQSIDAAWEEVERRVATKQANQYDQAVKELTDLRDLATRDGHIEQFDTRLLEFVRRHERKHAFLKRLQKAGLMT
ncbi:MAG: hypothetical protein EA424_19570 [Planctomycetaceae bacterium]|nr:MAG: hypothetical protein EA424_19570 [Planctomycetaceae bacterium]